MGLIVRLQPVLHGPEKALCEIANFVFHQEPGSGMLTSNRDYLGSLFVLSIGGLTDELRAFTKDSESGLGLTHDLPSDQTLCEYTISINWIQLLRASFPFLRPCLISK